MILSDEEMITNELVDALRNYSAGFMSAQQVTNYMLGIVAEYRGSLFSTNYDAEDCE